MPNRLQQLRIGEGSLVDQGGNQHAHVRLFKRHGGEPMKTLDEILKSLDANVAKSIREALAGEVAKSATAKDAEIAGLKAELEKAKAKAKKAEGEDDETDEEVMKGLPEKVRKQIEADRARTVELEKRLQGETDARQTREFIEKAANTYKNLGISPLELGPVLKQLHGFNPELAAKVETVLASADAVAKRAEQLTKELGRGTVVTGDSALGRMQKAAEELVLAKRAPNVAKAFDIVMVEQPALYDEYLAESSGR